MAVIRLRRKELKDLGEGDSDHKGDRVNGEALPLWETFGHMSRKGVCQPSPK